MSTFASFTRRYLHWLSCIIANWQRVSTSTVLWFYRLKTGVDISFIMMTSSNGNIFRVTGPLCGEFTGHRWIPLTKASDVELWYFLAWVNSWANTRLETASRSLWRHCNVMEFYQLAVGDYSHLKDCFSILVHILISWHNAPIFCDSTIWHQTSSFFLRCF